MIPLEISEERPSHNDKESKKYFWICHFAEICTKL